MLRQVIASLDTYYSLIEDRSHVTGHIWQKIPIVYIFSVYLHIHTYIYEWIYMFSQYLECTFDYIQFSLQSLTDATTNTSISEKYGSAYCLMGLYIPALLSEAYGFTSETQKITLIRKIKDISVGKFDFSYYFYFSF